MSKDVLLFTLMTEFIFWLSGSLHRFCETAVLVLDEERCKMEVLKWKMITTTTNNNNNKKKKKNKNNDSNMGN